MHQIAPETKEVQFLYPVEERIHQPSTEEERTRTGGPDLSGLVIIPTYNERENLPRLVTALLAIDTGLDILVIDDGSPDGTGDVADAIALQSPRVHVLHREGKLGLGTAYVAGFKYALAQGYPRIVQMDADFSHRPEDLPLLLKATAAADVVVGSRNVPGGHAEDWSPFRDFLSKGGSIYARTLLGLPIHDCTSGFKCFRRVALEALDLDALGANGFGFQVEVNYALTKAGMRFAEVPIVFPNRTQGESKMSSPIIVEAAVLVLKLALGITPAPVAVPARQPVSS